jgi:hypothetical protein
MQRSRTARLIRGGDPHSLWSRQPDLECLHEETHMSTYSSIAFDVGRSPPWLARLSIRIRTGAGPACATCRAAANLKLCPGTTR